MSVNFGTSNLFLRIAGARNILNFCPFKTETLGEYQSKGAIDGKISFQIYLLLVSQLSLTDWNLSSRTITVLFNTISRGTDQAFSGAISLLDGSSSLQLMRNASRMNELESCWSFDYWTHLSEESIFVYMSSSIIIAIQQTEWDSYFLVWVPPSSSEGGGGNIK